MLKGHVGLDSQCYTYLIDAMSDVHEPSDSLADQRMALFRIFLYREECLFVMPTVKKEFEAISNIARAEKHDNWMTLFPETQLVDAARVARRASELSLFHSGIADCRIVAEAEDGSLDTLLTFDDNLIARLETRTPVRLLRPADYWKLLSVPRGATPATSPRNDNPMARVTWWRWV